MEDENAAGAPATMTAVEALLPDGANDIGVHEMLRDRFVRGVYYSEHESIVAIALTNSEKRHVHCVSSSMHVVFSIESMPKDCCFKGLLRVL